MVSSARTVEGLVTVVIPCFNLGSYLEEAIDSVRAQTYPHWELIVVDDGSSDNDTINYINQLATEATDLRVIKQNNLGLSQTRNNGIAQAHGAYVVCLDADDKLEPTYLERCMEVFENNVGNNNVAIVTTWLREFGLRDDLWKPVDYDVAEILVTNRLHAASMLRKDVWAEAGGYKEEMDQGYEDWEFWLNLVERGYEWRVVPETLFRYRIREGSMLSNSTKSHDQSYAKICKLHETLFNENAVDFAKAINHEYRATVDYLAKQTNKLNRSVEETAQKDEQILDLQTSLFNTTHELAELKGSRLISQAIIIRGKVGKLRNGTAKTVRRARHLPRFIVHKTRVSLAPFIPRPVRKTVKKAVTYVRKTLGPKAQYVSVANPRVEDGEPIVSIVTPYYNAAKTIDETLGSLRDQTFKSLEVIIVNDGSTDTASKKKFSSLNPAGLLIHLETQPNQGVAVARNNGLKRARGKYLMCLDSDDRLSETFIEKAVVYLETHPGCSLVNYYGDFFGIENRIEPKVEYDPLALIENNMVVTAALYRREAWEATGGYKAKIGYEDWEYWISQAEAGYWGKTIPEALFCYRTSAKSRYTEDKMVQWENIRTIRNLHPNYKKIVRRLIYKTRHIKKILDQDSAYINLDRSVLYARPVNDYPNVLLALPWMTFGGAETLIYNFCNEILSDYNISFITGLKSEHEWEWKFKEISPNIYHLANLFEDEEMYVDFISNYIKTRDIKILHIVHTSFMFRLLPELRKRHPNLKVIVTLFNDRAEHFKLAVESRENIDIFSTDNNLVADHFRRLFGSENKPIVRIPNGINCYDNYNPELYDKHKQRKKLGLKDGEKAVFFIGRLSEEKNPDVFLEVARRFVIESQKNVPKVKFFIIGDGVMKEQVEETVRHINSDSIVYLGYQAKIAPYLSAADIFVLPSSVEGFPLSILEAMAMNVAVISSRVGAVPDIIEDGKNGMIVTPGSAKEIEERIRDLLVDEKVLSDIQRESRKAVVTIYSNKVLGKNYKRMYREAIE